MGEHYNQSFFYQNPFGFFVIKYYMVKIVIGKFLRTMNNDYSLYEERKNSTEIVMKKHGIGNRNKNRRRRRELFLMPGTQWCGRGSRATKYTNLGGFSKADACCRKHDTACPFYIPAFESRYGLFNLGITTLMHCTCDERLV